jgi:hypothetical protein
MSSGHWVAGLGSVVAGASLDPATGLVSLVAKDPANRNRCCHHSFGRKASAQPL